MRKWFAILSLFLFAVPVAAQQLVAWRGYVLIDFSSLAITQPQVVEALSHYSRLEGEFPDDLLQTRWALSGTMLIAEAAWEVEPTEYNIEMAFSGLTGLDLLEVQPYVTVYAFPDAAAVRAYIVSNIALWELPE